MHDYQRNLVSQFFEPLSSLSQESCHQFISHHIAPILLPDTVDKVDVQPSPFQGSMSYTTILHTHEHRFAVQFRSNKQDSYGVSEANRIHGPIVPMVTFQGTYEELFVYTSPFEEGIPYISDALFGYMTPAGWQDGEDHQELETAFYDRALGNLAAQGFRGIVKEQLEAQKAVGMLVYGGEQPLKFKDEQSELYLDGYLRGCLS